MAPKDAVRTLIEDVIERSLTDRTRDPVLLLSLGGPWTSTGLVQVSTVSLAGCD
jgi:hypothetical protein